MLNKIRETIGETERKAVTKQHIGLITYLHPSLHHAIVSIPQELLPSMTDHIFHTNVEPEKKHNITNLVCDYNIYYYTSGPACCLLLVGPGPERFIVSLFLLQISNKVSFTSSSLPALIKENICFSSRASSSYYRIERGLWMIKLKQIL